MEQIYYLLETYGYIILLVGSFFEGESIVITAGFLSYQGVLSLPICILLAFTGSVLADQILFFVGRKYGPGFISRRPQWQEKSKKVFDHLHKHSTLFIMGFRFIYGIRTISPIVIGASGVPIKRFAVLNILAGAIWATLSCGIGYILGYFFADHIISFFASLKTYNHYAYLTLVAVVVLIAARILHKKLRKKKDID